VQIDLAALPDDPTLLQQMLRDMAAAAEQRHTILQVAMQEREAENDKLRLLIQRLLRHQFGRRSEQLDPDQLQLGLEDLEQTIAEGEAAQDAAEGDEASGQQRRASRPRRNHGALPAHLGLASLGLDLPRYEVVIDVEDKACPCCAGALHLIGEDRSEQLDIVPAQLRVRVTRRPRYGCRACEGAVVQAPAPERPIDGGMATLSASLTSLRGIACGDGAGGARRCQQVLRPSAAVSPGRDAGSTGRDPGPLDVGVLGRPGLLVADAALRPGGQHRAVLLQGVRRRHHTAGAGPWPGPDQDGAALVLRHR
jgi:hypothetical protein